MEQQTKGQSRAALQQNRTMQAYYRMQSRIYDLTRWTFLFGRRRILRRLPFGTNEPFHLLEVGCGTGYNLSRLARMYPNARLTGLEISADMLRIARRKQKRHSTQIRLLNAPYTNDPHPLSGTLDIILFSYSLSMINPQWEHLLERARADLRPGGMIAVVDFHASKFRFFQNHMARHHVRMEGHLQVRLRELFEPVVDEVRPAYAGTWHYLLFLGR